MKKNIAFIGQINNKKLLEIKVVSLLGLGILAKQFPFACKNGTYILSELEKQNIHYYTLCELAELIKSRNNSSEELTQLILNKMDAIDGYLNSYIKIIGKDALVQARILDKKLAERGPLHVFLPLGVKDQLYTSNAPTTASHSFNSNFIASYNAASIDRF